MTRPLGLCSIAALGRPLPAVAALAVASGLDGIEATARPPHVDPSASLDVHRATARAIRDTGATVLAYGSYVGHVEVDGAAALDPRAAAHASEIAHALGAPLLRVWAEPIPGAPEDGFADVVALLRATCDAAAAHGIDVVVERHLLSFADTPERVERLLAAVDRANFALNYQVLDLLPQVEAAAQPGDASRLIPHARYYHLKNVCPASDGSGPMFPGASLADGVLDYRAILAAAFAAGYAGPLSIEFLSREKIPLEDKVAADAAWLRALVDALERP